MRRLLNILLVIVVYVGGFAGLAAPARAATSPGLTITISPFPPVVNQPARITLVAANPGPAAIDNVVVTMGVPNNMSIEGVSASQGSVSVYNSAITVHAGRVEPGQGVTVSIDVVVVTAYPTDAPFNVCAGLTYTDGVARLACLPNQPAAPPGSRPIGDLPPNGQRPISDPNRPPVFLPVSGAAIEPAGGLLVLSGLTLAALGWRRRPRA
jgi:uncharacterized repeat protein (TIGR01451 family)